jgi:hypothetical protein
MTDKHGQRDRHEQVSRCAKKEQHGDDRDHAQGDGQDTPFRGRLHGRGSSTSRAELGSYGLGRPSPCRGGTFGCRAPQPSALRPGRAASGLAARGGWTFPRRLPRLSRQLGPGGRGTRFTLQRATSGPGPRARCPFLASTPPFAERTFRRATCARRCRPFLWWWQVDPCLPRLREADRNRLFRGARAVFAFTNVLDLLAHEFTGLGRGCAAGPFSSTSSFECSFARHGLRVTQVPRRPRF